MEKKNIYTIGHGNRKLHEFLSLLKKFSIEYLIDVRSVPYSGYNPQFNQNNLKVFLEQNGITYVFMGDSIGGRPSDASCYDSEGKVDYEIVKTKKFFIDGIERLKNALKKNLSVVLMCSESNPCECHRSKLIGRVLSSEKIFLMHIDENGNLKEQQKVINEINKGRSEYDLFGNPINVTSRKSYL